MLEMHLQPHPYLQRHAVCSRYVSAALIHAAALSQERFLRFAVTRASQHEHAFVDPAQK
jgi:hypothetical protein